MYMGGRYFGVFVVRESHFCTAVDRQLIPGIEVRVVGREAGQFNGGAHFCDIRSLCFGTIVCVILFFVVLPLTTHIHLTAFAYLQR